MTVALMNNGSILVTDTPQNVKQHMNGTIIELVTRDVRGAHAILRDEPEVLEVQTFGDRLNIILYKQEYDERLIRQWLEGRGIEITQLRAIAPSLENVFISLMRENTPAGA
jgi:ABC-2 type transport system ATP-binding protein